MLVNLQGPPLAAQVPGYAVRQATERDLDACNAVCRRLHGHDRGGELREAIERGTATVVEHGDSLAGYATVLRFPGHAVGEGNAALKALIGAAPEFTGPGFLLPTSNGEVFRWCLAHGLRVVQPLTLMSRGIYNEPQGAFPHSTELCGEASPALVIPLQLYSFIPILGHPHVTCRVRSRGVRQHSPRAPSPGAPRHRNAYTAARYARRG
jgi:hypothetical protein